jgi:hypothetical protein
VKVDLSTTIGGQPMLVIRKFLRQVGNSSWGVSYVRRLFSVGEHEAQELVAGLVKRGYIKKSEHAIGDGWWEVSAAGKRVALANSKKKITRGAADIVVSSLLQRAKEVNAEGGYLVRVRRMTAFGSYVEGEPAIDDIDVEIELERKEADEQKHRQALEKKVAEAKSKGRTFLTEAEELGWGELEVLLYLKSRSRYLSFIQIPPEWRRNLPSKVLFDANKQ